MLRIATVGAMRHLLIIRNVHLLLHTGRVESWTAGRAVRRVRKRTHLALTLKLRWNVWASSRLVRKLSKGRSRRMSHRRREALTVTSSAPSTRWEWPIQVRHSSGSHVTVSRLRGLTAQVSRLGTWSMWTLSHGGLPRLGKRLTSFARDIGQKKTSTCIVITTFNTCASKIQALILTLEIGWGPSAARRRLRYWGRRIGRRCDSRVAGRRRDRCCLRLVRNVFSSGRRASGIHRPKRDVGSVVGWCDRASVRQIPTRSRRTDGDGSLPAVITTLRMTAVHWVAAVHDGWTADDWHGRWNSVLAVHRRHRARLDMTRCLLADRRTRLRARRYRR